MFIYLRWKSMALVNNIKITDLYSIYSHSWENVHENRELQTVTCDHNLVKALPVRRTCSGTNYTTTSFMVHCGQQTSTQVIPSNPQRPKYWSPQKLKLYIGCSFYWKCFFFKKKTQSNAKLQVLLSRFLPNEQPAGVGKSDVLHARHRPHY